MGIIKNVESKQKSSKITLEDSETESTVLRSTSLVVRIAIY